MASELYSEVKGKGDEIVLLHGWGMHGGLWGQFADQLAQQYRLHLLDLPGYGYSKDYKDGFSFDSITKVIEQYISEIKKPVTLIGWSLGGLIALNLIKKKNINIEKLVFLATTPCFTKKYNWEAAMEQSVFDAFSQDLKTDYKKTLKRFLALQTRGSELARDDLRELNEKLLQRGEPNINALMKGLEILGDTDMREAFISAIPAMLVLGEKDRLVPVTVASEFGKMFSNFEKLVLEKTGHAPFISRPEFCAEKIKNFINE